jgi:hypothetical protein
MINEASSLLKSVALLPVMMITLFVPSLEQAPLILKHFEFHLEQGHHDLRSVE